MFGATLSELGRIKGLAFSEFLRWYGERHGRARIVSAIELLQDRYPDAFDVSRPGFGVLASHWYPAELVHALLDRITEGASPADLDDMALEAAQAIMSKTIRGAYRALFALLVSPARYAKYIGKLWNLHYDSGEIIIDKATLGSHRMKYKGWRSHHPFICRMNMAAAFAIYETMGCEGVEVQRLGCISDGDACCENLITWVE